MSVGERKCIPSLCISHLKDGAEVGSGERLGDLGDLQTAPQGSVRGMVLARSPSMPWRAGEGVLAAEDIVVPLLQTALWKAAWLSVLLLLPRPRHRMRSKALLKSLEVQA